MDAIPILTELALRTRRMRLVSGVLSVWGRSCDAGDDRRDLHHVSAAGSTLGWGQHSSPGRGLPRCAVHERCRPIAFNGDQRPSVIGGRVTEGSQVCRRRAPFVAGVPRAPICQSGWRHSAIARCRLSVSLRTDGYRSS